MATVRLNGQSNVNNVTCFSYAPTILEVSSSASGSYTIWQINVGQVSSISSNMYVKVNNVILDMVTNIKEAKGYRFYMTTSSTMSHRKLMANSLMDALRRIPEIAAGYDVYMPYSGSEKQLQIVMKSKTYGNNTPLEITTNISALSMSHTDGSAQTEFKDGYLNVDIYKMSPAQKYNNQSPGTGSYIKIGRASCRERV